MWSKEKKSIMPQTLRLHTHIFMEALSKNNEQCVKKEKGKIKMAMGLFSGGPGADLCYPVLLQMLI